VDQQVLELNGRCGCFQLRLAGILAAVGETKLPVKRRSRTEILSEMTDIIVGHLEKMPPVERHKRLAAFGESTGGKRARVRAKAPSVSGTPRKSRRSQA
jgi:hypothetical protein